MTRSLNRNLKLFLLILLLGISSRLNAASIYVDNTLSGNCSGTYNISSRNCSGSSGSAYTSIQQAINNSNVGDVIYMRGGTYSEIGIDIPESKNGTAWTAGNYTTLRSYHGEWAIVDGTGLNTGSVWYDQAVFTHPTGYGAGSPTQYNEYWYFRNFEVTGGRSGFFLKTRHVKWHYMYIHDNGRARGSSDTLVAGILLVCPQYSEIKYSFFKDNMQTSGSDMNNSNILFDSDYKDDAGNGDALVITAATHHNEVAYNYLEGSMISIRQKNQQRFGLNDRNPNDMTYMEYGDKWHHNIILGATEAIGASQDFVQVHNNITDSTINIGRMSGSSGDIPQIYNAVIYNNTVKRDPSLDASYGSYVTSAGYNPSFDNYYDAGPSKTIHEHLWFYNNIADNNPNAYQDIPFMLHWNIPANSSTPVQDNSDLVVENNLIHNNYNSNTIFVGHNFDSGFTGCANQIQTLSELNSCSEAWRGVSDVINWENTSSGLYVSASGSDQFVTNWSFNLDGSTTICYGGKGGNHPYLSSTLPSYVGATNPNNKAWVAGIYNDTTSTAWLRDQVLDEPSWTEEKGSQSTLCVFPNSPIPDPVVQ